MGLDKVDAHVQAVIDIMPGPLRQKSWWTSNPDLKTLHEKFCSSQASDPRDRIYALLGISSDAFGGTGISPDYGVDVYTVVHCTISHLLFKDQGRDALPAPFWGLDDFFDALEDLPRRVLGWYYSNEPYRQYKQYCELYGIDKSFEVLRNDVFPQHQAVSKTKPYRADHSPGLDSLRPPESNLFLGPSLTETRSMSMVQRFSRHRVCRGVRIQQLEAWPSRCIVDPQQC
jgi:hypothetical protein